MATTVVFTFGRMNPPTIGHEKLVNKVKSIAKKYKGEPRLYLSHTQNSKKDPLDYNLKTKTAQQAFGIVKKSTAKHALEVATEISKKEKDVTHLVMVVGSDRYSEFKALLNKYNGKLYTFDKLDVESAGQRDPDAEGVEGMSGTKLRGIAKDGDMKTFMKGLASKMSNANKKKIYDTLRSVMEEPEIVLTDADIDFYEWDDDELDAMEIPPELEFFALNEEEEKESNVVEFLTVQQRKAIGRRMKRLAPRLQRKKKMAQKKMATPAKLIKRANAAAINILRKKMAGSAGGNYASLSPQQKMAVDKRIEKKKAGFAQKMRGKLLPKIKKKEMERLKMARNHNRTSEELNALVGDFLAEAKKAAFVGIDSKTGKKVGEYKNKKEADAAKKKNKKIDIITSKDYEMMTEAKFKADVEGIGTIYVDGGSAGQVKAQLKKVVKKADLIKSVDRIQKGEYKKELKALMKGDKEEDSGDMAGLGEARGKRADGSVNINVRSVPMLDLMHSFQMAMKEKPGSKKQKQLLDKIAKLKGQLGIKGWVGVDEGKMKELHGYIQQKKDPAWIAKKMGLDPKTIKALMGEKFGLNHNIASLLDKGNEKAKAHKKSVMGESIISLKYTGKKMKDMPQTDWTAKQTEGTKAGFGKKLTGDKGKAFQPRQFKDPKKEMMIHKKGHGVIVIDKSDWKIFKKAGFIQAEGVTEELNEKLKLKDFKVGMWVQGKGGAVGQITANQPRGDNIVVKWNKTKKEVELPIKGLGLYTKPKLQGLVQEARKVDPADVDDAATDADIENAAKNIIMQMRKVVSLRGLKPVEFGDGKKKKISVNDAQKAIAKYQKLRTSIQKGDFQMKLAKSHKDFMKAIKEDYSLNTEAKILVGLQKRINRSEFDQDTIIDQYIIGGFDRVDAFIAHDGALPDDEL